MESGNNWSCLGIDLDDWNAIVSYYELSMNEPETISTVPEGTRFQIPVVLAKTETGEEWLIGEEARKLVQTTEESGVRLYFKRTLRNESVTIWDTTYQTRELLDIFFQKLMQLISQSVVSKPVDKVVIAVEKITKENTAMFMEMAQKAGFEAGQLTLIDRKESFYYFACSRERELWLHDVFLFDYRLGSMNCVRLTRDQQTTPQVVTLTAEERSMDTLQKDESFLRIIQSLFSGHIISAVYLVGDGFDGNWMKDSLAYMCQSRRAFMGKNLYSKGACYAAAVREEKIKWPLIYMGDNEMKVNVSLKVYNQDVMEFYTLINAGDNWFETQGSCDVLLDGKPEIDFWLQLPNSRHAKIEKLELADLPSRPPRTTKLHIQVNPLSDRSIMIEIQDLGFGELFESTGKHWEYQMNL